MMEVEFFVAIWACALVFGGTGGIGRRLLACELVFACLAVVDSSIDIYQMVWCISCVHDLLIDDLEMAFHEFSSGGAIYKNFEVGVVTVNYTAWYFFWLTQVMNVASTML